MPSWLDVLLAELHPALWIAWVIYWRISAIGSKAIAREETRLQRFRHFGPIFLALFIFAASNHVPYLDTRIFQPTGLTYGLGTALLVVGLLFSAWARVVLGRNWSGTVAVKEDHELIQNGPYRWVRHPIYTGILTALIGSTVAEDRWGAVLAVAVMTAAFWFKLLREEAWMRETFGATYVRYSARTKRLIPFLL